MKKSWLLSLCVALLSTAAEAQQVQRAPDHDETESMAALADSEGDLSVIPPPSKLFTLQQAVERAIASTPRLKGMAASVAAARGELQQAGLIPNPELGLEVENMGGTGAYKGLNASEITVGMSQLVELGGKRTYRQQVAAQSVAIRQWEYEAERLDVIRDVTVAYHTSVAARENLALTRRQKELAADLLAEVNRRVDAAREPLIQRSKAEITLSVSSLAEDRAEREQLQAQQVLAGYFGEKSEALPLDETTFFVLDSPLSPDQVMPALARNPSLKRWEAEQARSQAMLDLELAQAVPDPRISVGVRSFADSSDRALVAGLSIPIPVFDRNQGTIEKSRQDRSKTEQDAVSAALALRLSAFATLQDLTNAYRQAESLKATILPSSERAFQLAREGYRAGRFAFLEVLDSQRTLFEARTQYITALREYHKAAAEIDRLMATHQTLISPGDSHAQ